MNETIKRILPPSHNLAFAFFWCFILVSRSASTSSQSVNIWGNVQRWCAHWKWLFAYLVFDVNNDNYFNRFFFRLFELLWCVSWRSTLLSVKSFAKQMHRVDFPPACCVLLSCICARCRKNRISHSFEFPLLRINSLFSKNSGRVSREKGRRSPWCAKHDKFHCWISFDLILNLRCWVSISKNMPVSKLIRLSYENKVQWK